MINNNIFQFNNFPSTTKGDGNISYFPGFGLSHSLLNYSSLCPKTPSNLMFPQKSQNNNLNVDKIPEMLTNENQLLSSDSKPFVPKPKNISEDYINNNKLSNAILDVNIQNINNEENLILLSKTNNEDNDLNNHSKSSSQSQTPQSKFIY